MEKLSDHMRGITVCAFIGGLAILGSQAYDVPVMLTAIILGLIVHFLASVDELNSGINWCAKNLLYIGVALLGLRIDLTDLSQTGYIIPAIIISTLFATIAIGFVISRAFGQTKGFSLLIGSSVAICGVSAAAAISATMENSENHEQELAITVAGITVLSTIAMILYPAIAQGLKLSDLASGMLMGGGIHNVSQAVGAGLTVSEGSGDISVLLKLLRVSMLLPIIFIVAIFVGKKTAAKHTNIGQKFLAYFPPFLITFFILALLSCLHVVPTAITIAGKELANIALVISLVAIGIKTDLKQVVTVGAKPLIAMTITTTALAMIILTSIYLLGISSS